MSVFEVVLFKPLPDVSDADLHAAARGAQDEIAALPGYVGRELGRAADGGWLDQVCWQSMEAAQAASQAVMTLPACTAYFRLIDEASIVMRHYIREPL